jgi:hypothetical protein
MGPDLHCANAVSLPVVRLHGFIFSRADIALLGLHVVFALLRDEAAVPYNKPWAESPPDRTTDGLVYSAHGKVTRSFAPYVAEQQSIARRSFQIVLALVDPLHVPWLQKTWRSP